MVFETVRKLKNYVFSTSLVRKVIQDDEAAEIEKGLEDDFGPVVVDAGGMFEGYVTKAEAKDKPTVSLTGPEAEGTIKIKFALENKNLISLDQKAIIKYSCNAENETSKKVKEGVELTPLEVAEVKCKIFEAVMKEKINKAVEEWKAKKTDFETAAVDTFEVHLEQ